MERSQRVNGRMPNRSPSASGTTRTFEFVSSMTRNICICCSTALRMEAKACFRKCLLIPNTGERPIGRRGSGGSTSRITCARGTASQMYTQREVSSNARARKKVGQGTIRRARILKRAKSKCRFRSLASSQKRATNWVWPLR